MIFKITIEIEGKDLYPDKLVSKLSSELEVIESFTPVDTFLKKGKIESYGFGGLYLMHPNGVCYAGDNVEAYENIFVDFLKNNYKKIINNGGDEINISYEVYFSGDNFSLGLFNRKHLAVITECNASISFSGYQMSDEKIMETFGR